MIVTLPVGAASSALSTVTVAVVVCHENSTVRLSLTEVVDAYLIVTPSLVALPGGRSPLVAVTTTVMILPWSAGLTL